MCYDNTYVKRKKSSSPTSILPVSYYILSCCPSSTWKEHTRARAGTDGRKPSTNQSIDIRDICCTDRGAGHHDHCMCVSPRRRRCRCRVFYAHCVIIIRHTVLYIYIYMSSLPWLLLLLYRRRRRHCVRADGELSPACVTHRAQRRDTYVYQNSRYTRGRNHGGGGVENLRMPVVTNAKHHAPIKVTNTVDQSVTSSFVFYRSITVSVCVLF